MCRRLLFGMLPTPPSDSTIAASGAHCGPTRHHHGPCDSLEQEAYLNLWRTFDRLKAVEEEVFDRHGLSAQQYNALRVLADVAPESLPTLALGGRLVSRAPDITRMLDRLERRSLVRRDRQAANRRVVRVTITPAGRALLDSMAAEVLACGTHQLGHMTSADLRQLVALLRTARGPHEPAAGQTIPGPAAVGDPAPLSAPPSHAPATGVSP